MLWLAAVSMMACGGGKGGGSGSTRAISVAEAEPLCEQGCQQQFDCGEGSDVATCTVECANSVAGWMRVDALETMAACGEQLACGSENTCAQQVQPLAIHTEYEAECRAMLAVCQSDLEFKCEVNAPPEGNETLLRFVAPEIMTEVLTCFDGGDCTIMSQCVSDTLNASGFPLAF